MIATTLREADFIDLYLGEDYAEIKGMVGATGFLVPVPAPLMDDVRQLHKRCADRHRDAGRNEFSCFYDQRLYRATVSQDLFGRTDIVLR